MPATVPPPWARAVAETYAAPTCTKCADFARAVAAVAPAAWSAGYAAGHADGHAQGLAEGLAEGPAHPAVVDSVRRVFGGWDGHAAALARSVVRFRQQHAAARQEVNAHERRRAA